MASPLSKPVYKVQSYTALIITVNYKQSNCGLKARLYEMFMAKMSQSDTSKASLQPCGGVLREAVLPAAAL